MSGLGALTRLLKVLGPELKDKRRLEALEETGYHLRGGEFDAVPSAGRADLRDFLRDSDPMWDDMAPGAMPFEGRYGGQHIRRVPDVSPEETWYRGSGNTGLKLQEPVFATRDPRGAGWYAMEGPNNNNEGFGAVGEYLALGANPARERDMYRILLDDPSLEKTIQSSGNYNVWDWLYSPEMRQATKDRGFNAGLGLDPLDRDDIETLIALDKQLLQPQRRTIVGWDSGRLGDIDMPKKPWKFDDELLQFGEPRPWSKKAKGGLARMSDYGN